MKATQATVAQCPAADLAHHAQVVCNQLQGASMVVVTVA